MIDGKTRWAKPVKLLDVQHSPALVMMPRGELMGEVEVAVTAEDLQRMREGRVCANCFEPFEEPWPEICNALKLPDGTVIGCYYKVRDRQLADLEGRHGAGKDVHIGSRIRLADELERMNEHAAYEAKHGIVLPDSVKFPTGEVK